MSDKAVGVRTADGFVFRYRTNYASDLIWIEWPNDTMFAAIPSEYVDHLLREGYARLMTAVEADAYNEYIKGEKP
jgi:hypothetical protein